MVPTFCGSLFYSGNPRPILGQKGTKLGDLGMKIPGLSPTFCPPPHPSMARLACRRQGTSKAALQTLATAPEKKQNLQLLPRPWVEIPYPHSNIPIPTNRLKWVVHLAQNGTIGFDPRPHSLRGPWLPLAPRKEVQNT